MSANHNEFLAIEEASRILRVSRAQMYRLVRDKALRSYQFGGCKRVRKTDLEAFIENSKRGAEVENCPSFR